METSKLKIFMSWMNEIKDEGPDIKKQNILKRDYFLTFFNDLKLHWSEDELL